GVALTISSNPDVALVIHVHAVLAVFGARIAGRSLLDAAAFHPFILACWRRAAPALHVLALLIEFTNRRRRYATVRNTFHSQQVLLIDGGRPVTDPDMILGVDRDAAHLAERPFLRH